MTTGIFLAVLFSALLHASWNAIVKTGSDKLLSTALVTAASSLLSLLCLPWLPQPDVASWPFIAGSVALQLVYFQLIAAAYHAADMGVCYPIMRGTAPLLVALASVFRIGDGLSATAWIGVVGICAGILTMTSGLQPHNRRGALLALANAFIIAGYTLTDGIGVRRSGAPVAYTLWIFFLTGLLFALWTAATRRAAYTATLRANWRAGLLGGAGSVGSYAIVLWAMTRAPLAEVAALRETSILFAAMMVMVWLKESIRPHGLVAIALIIMGAMVLRLA